MQKQAASARLSQLFPYQTDSFLSMEMEIEKKGKFYLSVLQWRRREGEGFLMWRGPLEIEKDMNAIRQKMGILVSQIWRVEVVFAAGTHPLSLLNFEFWNYVALHLRFFSKKDGNFVFLFVELEFFWETLKLVKNVLTWAF